MKIRVGILHRTRRSPGKVNNTNRVLFTVYPAGCFGHSRRLSIQWRMADNHLFGLQIVDKTPELMYSKYRAQIRTRPPHKQVTQFNWISLVL